MNKLLRNISKGYGFSKKNFIDKTLINLIYYEP